MAQTPPVDSLKTAFARTPSSHFKAYFDTLDAHLATLSLKQALSAVDYVRAHPPADKSPLIEFYVTNSLALLYNYHKRYANADELLQKNLIYTQEHRLPLEQAQTLQQLGNVYSSLYKYSEAVHYMNQASDIYIQLGMQKKAALLFYEIGDACYKGNERKGCEEYFQKALALGADSLSSRIKVSSYNTLGLIRHYQHDYPTAITYFEKSLALAAQAQDSAWIGIAKGNIGSCLIHLNRAAEAQLYIEQDLAISIRGNDWGQVANGYYLMGLAYSQQKNIALALHYYLTAADMALKYGNTSLLKNIYIHLAQTYQQKKQFDKAFSYLQLHGQLSDSLAQQSQAIAVIKAQSTFDLQKKELELRNLMEEEHRREQITLFIVIASVLFLLALLLTLQVYQKIKTNRLLSKQKEELQTKNQQLERQQMEIETQNEELVQNQEEIATQHDLLSVQNQELQRIQEIIGSQNEEIQMKNLHLEELVENRTQKLLEHTRQLQEFAFITAHNLRAPVAQILGLGQLLHLPDNQPEEEKLYIEKLIDSTRQLDQIVKEMTDVLTNQTPDDL